MRLATAQGAAIGTAAGVAPHLVHAMTLAHYADRAVGIDAATGRFLRAFPWGAPEARATARTAWQTPVGAGN